MVTICHAKGEGSLAYYSMWLTALYEIITPSLKKIKYFDKSQIFDKNKKNLYVEKKKILPNVTFLSKNRDFDKMLSF